MCRQAAVCYVSPCLGYSKQIKTSAVKREKEEVNRWDVYIVPCDTGYDYLFKKGMETAFMPGIVFESVEMYQNANKCLSHDFVDQFFNSDALDRDASLVHRMRFTLIIIYTFSSLNGFCV